MNLEFGQYNLQDLVNLHRESESRLKASLLAGDAWEDLQQQLAFVTQLAIMIDQKKHPATTDQLIYPYRDMEGTV